MFEEIAKIQHMQTEPGDLTIQGFPLGLNTNVPAEMISAKELAVCKDMKINKGGRLESRRPLRIYTTVAATGEIKAIATAVISGTIRTIVCDSNNRIYYLNGTTLTYIATAESEASLIPYNDVCLVADGGILKYLDGVTSLKLAYDGGDDGVQFDNYLGDSDSEIKIGDGTNTRVAVKFTTDGWIAGYTIPITEVEAKLKRTGSPSGAITCKLRLVSDDSVLATKDLALDASEISTTEEAINVSFAATDITTEMSPGTAYYCTLEHSGGDSSNYIGLLCSTATAGACYYYTGSWSADVLKEPLMRVHPGQAPKASYGAIADNRPWLGGDSDNPGYVWYGNFTHLDFSTSNGGGYLSTVDENRNSFPVGGLESLYEDIYIYGTKELPFICKLIGSSPSDWSLPRTFQKAWTLPKTLINAINDLWSSSESGVDTLQGVDTYGDIRSFSVSERIENLIKLNWSSEAFAGYYPVDRQYWLMLPGYENILIANIASKVTLQTGEVIYPWNEYSLPTGLVPTAFGMDDGEFSIGAANGHLYKIDLIEYKDKVAATEVQILPEFKGASIEFPYDFSDLTDVQIIGKSKTGCKFDFNIFTNGSEESPTLTVEKYFAVSDTITIEELDMSIEDMDFFINLLQYPKDLDVNINCWSVQVGISNIVLYGEPVYFNGFFIKYNQLEV